MRPGIAPTYVFRCPRISASSLTPPREIRTYFLCKAFDSDFAMEVFPVPGGPTRQSIGLLPFEVKAQTAKNSSILSFTCSSP